MENSRRYDIICIGTAIVDSIIRGFDPAPVSASGYRAEEGTLNAGGEAVNEAMAAAKLGLSTGILCFTGNDAAGRIILDALQGSGVDTSLVLLSEKHHTPVTTMFVNNDGTRRSITNHSHKYNFHPERYISCFSHTKAVILGSLFRAPFDDPEIIDQVLRAARENNVVVFADTKLPNFHFLKLQDISASIPLIDYLTPNEDEARYYSGKEQPEDMADVFMDAGVGNVIIKLGSRGCYFKNNTRSFYLPAFPITPVDATGAGDNFIAGFASEILRGGEVYDALLFANACGAICTTAAGAGTALKNRCQVLDFLKNRI